MTVSGKNIKQLELFSGESPNSIENHGYSICLNNVVVSSKLNSGVFCELSRKSSKIRAESVRRSLRKKGYID